MSEIARNDENLHMGDCLPFLKTLPDNCVDLVVTDPPYEIKNTKPGSSNAVGERMRKSLKELSDNGICKGFDSRVLDELVRIQKNINMYIFCNTEQLEMYIDFFSKKHGAKLSIFNWYKTNAPPMFSNKPLDDKELCLFWRKNAYCKPQCYDDAKTIYLSPMNQADKKLFKHPTIKPQPLIEKLIRNSSKEGWTVIDPFMGSGTTGRAAKLLGRNFIGCEMNPEWFDIAETRIKTGLNNKHQLQLF